VTNTPRSGPISVPHIPGLTELSLLAVGGYATIFRAMQGSVGREVAVKVENFTLDSERDRARFMREARTAGKMSSHPHVVDLFDAGVTSDNHPYLIMELCSGSYQDQMSLPLRPEVVRDIGVKIADALADSHERGVVHRDVKPANILVTLFGEPALADFGLAIFAEQRDPHITLEVLTPAYAPPEAFRRQEPAPPADVYGLCATLYALLSGAPPRWQADQPPGLLGLIELFSEPIPEITGVSTAFTRILRRGMANDPAKRPTARALEDMLATVRLDEQEGPARVTGTAVAPRPPAEDGPPTVQLKQRGALASFIQQLFRR
jgi:serine/threonine protein kinase